MESQSILDAVMNSKSAPAPETKDPGDGRLTTSQVIQKVSLIGDSLRRMGELYKDMHDTSGPGIAQDIATIQEEAQKIVSYTQRLLDSNR